MGKDCIIVQPNPFIVTQLIGPRFGAFEKENEKKEFKTLLFYVTLKREHLNARPSSDLVLLLQYILLPNVTTMYCNYLYFTSR